MEVGVSTLRVCQMSRQSISSSPPSPRANAVPLPLSRVALFPRLQFRLRPTQPLHFLLRDPGRFALLRFIPLLPRVPFPGRTSTLQNPIQKIFPAQFPSPSSCPPLLGITDSARDASILRLNSCLPDALSLRIPCSPSRRSVRNQIGCRRRGPTSCAQLSPGIARHGRFFPSSPPAPD